MYSQDYDGALMQTTSEHPNLKIHWSYVAQPYVKNVGIRDGQFYVIAENNTDEIYLEYKEAVGNINSAMMEKMDFRIMAQKGIEYNTKKANAMKKFMEIPRD
jgi:hypothetical protein